jgi:hypothetical protein
MTSAESQKLTLLKQLSPTVWFSHSFGAVLKQLNIPRNPHLCSLPWIRSPGAEFNARAHTAFASSVSSIRLS